ncbi:MAG: FeoB-associated Cys-rich membrane protein [Desulfomonilaceae bacterium]|nr:FeoB-associated Cys-rich membrane protein [Desulfomonilaceae bacterium]
MWQEIVVGAIVALCAVFLVRRYLKNLRGAKSGKVACSCDCTGCDNTLNPPPACGTDEARKT